MPASEPTQPTVVLCGVRYSPNLGDGVLADCLAWLLRERHPGLQTRFLDLAGRTDFGQVTVPGRRHVVRLINALPSAVSDALFETLLARKVRRDLRPAWGEVLRGADAAVIGGGQILSDASPNFPVKLSGLVEELGEHRVPAAFCACGASEFRGGRGTEAFRRMLTANAVKYTSLRDDRSRERVARLTGRGTPPMAVDPAVHVADAYATELASVKRDRYDLAIGVADPGNLRFSSGVELPPPARIAAAFARVCRDVVGQGRSVLLFTNGAAEDEQFLDQLIASQGLDRVKGVVRAKAPVRPGELIASIASARVVIAHRMHASIIAFGLGVPTIGLEWDDKVRSFYELSGRGEWLVPRGPLDAEHLTRRVADAWDSCVDPEALARLRNQSAAAATDMLSALGLPAGAVPSATPNSV